MIGNKKYIYQITLRHLICFIWRQSSFVPIFCNIMSALNFGIECDACMYDESANVYWTCDLNMNDKGCLMCTLKTIIAKEFDDSHSIQKRFTHRGDTFDIFLKYDCDAENRARGVSSMCSELERVWEAKVSSVVSRRDSTTIEGHFTLR